MSDDATTAPAENNVAPSSERKNRTSMASRAAAEGEALLKEMGFEEKETPGRRRTRSSLRGDAYTPPTKKGKKAPTPGTGRRGRPPKKTEKKVEKPAPEEEEEKKEEEAKDVEKEEEEEEEKETNEKEEDKEKKEDDAPAEEKETDEASADGEDEEVKDDKKEKKDKKEEKAE